MRKILLTFSAVAALVGVGTTAIPTSANAMPAQPGYTAGGLVHTVQYHREWRHRHWHYWHHHRRYW